MIPEPTARLRFREMEEADLDAMAELLGDPEVMRHYPAPKMRDEALDWIRWSRRNYAEHGYGLWVIETHDGEFVGDCGLTRQPLDGGQVLEVGYHVVRRHWSRGYATEAARACVELGLREVGEPVHAIVVPTNAASMRVAEKAGLVRRRDAVVHGREAVVFAVDGVL